MGTLQRQHAENLKQIFPEKEYRGLSPNFHIHVSVNELYISTMGLPFLLEEICGPQFPEKEYINGIAVAVYQLLYSTVHILNVETRETSRNN
jgi:hypothetical protein